MEIPSNLLPIKSPTALPLIRQLPAELETILKAYDEEQKNITGCEINLYGSVLQLLSSGEYGIIADSEGKCYVVPLTKEAVLPSFVRRNI